MPQFQLSLLLPVALSVVGRNAERTVRVGHSQRTKVENACALEFCCRCCVASATASAAASAAARAMHTHTQLEPRCVTFCRLGRDRAASACLPHTLPMPLPLPLSSTLPLLTLFLASDPSTCDRLGCIYLLLDNNSSFAGMRWLLSLPLMSGPRPLRMCVCVHWFVCLCMCGLCGSDKCLAPGQLLPLLAKRSCSNIFACLYR